MAQEALLVTVINRKLSEIKATLTLSSPHKNLYFKCFYFKGIVGLDFSPLIFCRHLWNFTASTKFSCFCRGIFLASARKIFSHCAKTGCSQKKCNTKKGMKIYSSRLKGSLLTTALHFCAVLWRTNSKFKTSSKYLNHV